jgi:hypothetical protein
MTSSVAELNGSPSSGATTPPEVMEIPPELIIGALAIFIALVGGIVWDLVASEKITKR